MIDGIVERWTRRLGQWALFVIVVSVLCAVMGILAVIVQLGLGWFVCWMATMAAVYGLGDAVGSARAKGKK